MNFVSTLYELCFRINDTAVEGDRATAKINRDQLFIGSLDMNYDDIRISDDCSIEVDAAPLPEIKLSASDASANEGSNV